MSTAPPPFHLLKTLQRVWRMLTAQERQKAGLIFIGVLLNSFLEILGLAAVVPVIGVVMEPEIIQRNELLSRAFEGAHALGIATEREFLMLMSVGLFGAFLVKAVFSLALNLYQTRFSFAIGHRISGLMWQYHFSQSLERMRSTQSGRVLAEINQWPLNFSTNFIVGSLRLLNEVVVISIIGVGLVAYEPIVLLSVAGLMGVGAMIVRRATKKRMGAYSEVQKTVAPLTGTLINGAVRGFLEVISFRASNAIRNSYLEKTRGLYRVNGNIQVMNMVPGKLYEALAVAVVSASILISLMLENQNEDLFNLLIIMALSAYRTMPSMNRINGQIMAMRSYHHVFLAMEEGLNALRQGESPGAGDAATWPRVDLELRQLALGYESLDSPILVNIDCTFEAGKVHAIVGPSGSGKSTLVNALLGLHPLSAGSIVARAPNHQPQQLGRELHLEAWLSQVGYLSQHPFLFAGSVRENLTMRMADAELNEPEVLQLVDALGLRESLGEDPLRFELLEGGGNLSGGQQQRLAILRALRLNRPLLILDEATSALDGEKRDLVFELLRKRANSGTNIILVTHDPTLAAQCDSVLDLGRSA